MTKLSALIVAAAIGTACAACAAGPVAAPERSTTPTVSATQPNPAPSTSVPSRADAIREWEERAGIHFKESAAALEKISAASDSEDEAGLRAGCTRLHDTNSIGLQKDLPTPDPKLTAELQRMIDDMNVATHACLRFALARDPGDADTYQRYLAQAVEHLQRAKVMLNAAER